MKLILLFLLLSTDVFAYENEWFLKGGLGLNFQELKSDNLSQDDLLGFALSTSFGYRFRLFEIATASYITMGHADNLFLKVGNDFQLYADSNYWASNFLLLIKYFTNINVFKKHQLYFGLGPGIAIQTFWPKNYTVSSGSISGTEKISYETLGIYGTIGFEERTLFKEEFPVFADILWGFNRSYKASLVEVDDPKSTEIILTDNNHSNFVNFVLIISFGVTFL